MTEPEPFLHMTRGDRGVAQHLRDSLKVLMQRTDDPEFKRLVSRVVDGGESLRDVYDTAAFTRVLGPLVGSFVEQLRGLDDETVRLLQQQGEAHLRDVGRQHRPQPQPPADDDDNYPYGGPILTSAW
ncbi:hypothetical protein G4X40_14190 [Rhodococcus sp. D2-41]|uniref:Uncharacterized protein n=1 Tax=Speluncibacter jeojiensis TaxID=2710754 RepID=A0A9X4RF30_9ACTN|nr:hypothetical protein [Rhodococcus sp. D2-41]MDG3011302.1 hypothetical protein [Rhodococcus sp. D2-41]MDG3015847.1 hypothetical protein [Corynebacteriales bacterium D3-21]